MARNASDLPHRKLWPFNSATGRLLNARTCFGANDPIRFENKNRLNDSVR